MAKSEVYNWRTSVETKSVDETRQQRLHEAALKTIGTIQGDDPDRSSNAKTLLRAKLAWRRAK